MRFIGIKISSLLDMSLLMKYVRFCTMHKAYGYIINTTLFIITHLSSWRVPYIHAFMIVQDYLQVTGLWWHRRLWFGHFITWSGSQTFDHPPRDQQQLEWPVVTGRALCWPTWPSLTVAARSSSSAPASTIPRSCTDHLRYLLFAAWQNTKFAVKYKVISFYGSDRTPQ